MQSRLLVVDKDSRYAEWLRRHLGVLCPDATVGVIDATEFAARADTISRDEVDLLLLVASFGSSPEDPASLGLERLRQFRARHTAPAVIAIADDGNELTAVRAIQLGALDYIPKRLLTPERLNTSVKLSMRRVERRIARRMAKLSHSLTASERPAPESEDGEMMPASALSADFLPGYTIGVLLGESEKAVVHRATSHALGRDVALKISKSERSEGQLLAREYAAVSALRNDAIVQIYDYGTHAEREYLAMELFPRGDLKARLQQGVTSRSNVAALQSAMAHCTIIWPGPLAARTVVVTTVPEVSDALSPSTDNCGVSVGEVDDRRADSTGQCGATWINTGIRHASSTAAVSAACRFAADARRSHGSISSPIVRHNALLPSHSRTAVIARPPGLSR